MGLIKDIKKGYVVGWQTKELLLAGFKHEANDTKFILEVLSLINKYNINDTSNCLDIVEKLNKLFPISVLEDPLYNNEYLVINKTTWQSTRLKSLFSNDNGISWYNIDKVSFKMKFYRFLNKFIKIDRKNLLYYVQFPYNPNN